MKHEASGGRLPFFTYLIVAAAVWAPIAGGYVPTEGQFLPNTANALLTALLGDAAVPILSHALIALPVVLALIWVLVERQIQQVPGSRVSIPLVLLMGLILGTAPLSQFKSVSFVAVAEWAVYMVAFFATVACVGRSRGPQMVLYAIFIGCLIVALIGIREYGDRRLIDPTWRIFGNWMGPNSLAAMLIVGLIIGLAVTINEERVKAILAGIGTGLIGFALLLTQSKGGLLAAGGAIVVFAAVLVIWTRRDSLYGLARMAAVAAIIGGLALGVQETQRKAATAATEGGAAPTALTRLASSAQTQEQSAGFRRLLWQGSADLIRQNPAGYGAGTYRYWSAHTGRTTQTHLAHNSFLQMGVEMSVLAPLVLLAALIMWTAYLFKGGSAGPLSQRVLRAGTFAAVVGVSAHSIVDSDLQYFGIGFIFFMLLGIGLLLSADAVAPEFTPKVFRVLGSFFALFAGFILIWSGSVEAIKASARSYIAAQEYETAFEKIDTAIAMAPYDGEAWYMRGMLSRTEADRRGSFIRAAGLMPSTRNLRALARSQAEATDTSGAARTYERALYYDPNNLPTMVHLLNLNIAREDHVSAEAVAKKLVEVENTTYFKIRSQPDLIPTETAQGRAYLARQATGNEKIDLLAGALDILIQYRTRTLPQVVSFADSGLDYAGQGPEEARLVMREGAFVAEELGGLYRAAGRTADAEAAEAEVASFREAEASLK